MFHISQLDLLPHLPPASQDSAFSEAFHEAGWANSTQRPQKLVKACGLRMDQQDLRWITHLWCYIWLYNYSNIHWKTWYIYITLYNYIYISIYVYNYIYIWCWYIHEQCFSYSFVDDNNVSISMNGTWTTMW
jgi:hypothetical protein